MSTAASNQRSFANYLVKRRFQLKWTAWIIVVTIGIFSSLGAYLYKVEQLYTHGNEKICATLGYSLDDCQGVIGDFMDSGDRGTVWILFGLCVVLVLILAVVGIILTHRVAGPIYALGMFMDNVGKGSLKHARGFRKNDEFQELADGFQSMVASLREWEESEVKRLESIQEGTAETPEVASEIAAILENKRLRLG
jgi:methyl-accepting chemotaxis protein